MRLTAFENLSFCWRHHTRTIKAGTLCQNNQKQTFVKSYFEGQLSTEHPSPIQRHLSKVASNRILTTCFSPFPSTGKGKGRAHSDLSKVTSNLILTFPFYRKRKRKSSTQSLTSNLSSHLLLYRMSSVTLIPYFIDIFLGY